MKTNNIVASWDRGKAVADIRTQMLNDPSKFCHAFNAIEAPTELNEVMNVHAGDNQAILSELEQRELMETFMVFIDVFSDTSIHLDFAWMELQNDLALALFSRDYILGADFCVEEANFGQGSRPVMFFHAQAPDEFLDKIIPEGVESFQLIKSTSGDGQFVLHAKDVFGNTRWFVIETIDRKVKAEMDNMSFAEMLRKADQLNVHPDQLADTLLANYQQYIGGSA